LLWQAWTEIETQVRVGIEMNSSVHSVLTANNKFMCAAVYKVEGLKRDFNAHNKEIGKQRKVRLSLPWHEFIHVRYECHLRLPAI